MPFYEENRKMHVIILSSAVVLLFVTGFQGQLTVDDNSWDSCREDLATLTDELKDANEKLQRKESFIKYDLVKDNCTSAQTNKVCFERDDQLGIQQSVFDDLDSLPLGKLEEIFVTGMTLHFRNWRGIKVIGAIEVTYNTSGIKLVHGRQCSDRQALETERFKLDPGDKITTVNMHSGDMVDQLIFYTEKGRTHGPYGRAGGSGKRLSPRKPNGGYLAYVEGFVARTENCLSVRQLNLVWGFEKIKTR